MLSPSIAARRHVKRHAVFTVFIFPASLGPKHEGLRCDFAAGRIVTEHVDGGPKTLGHRNKAVPLPLDLGPGK